MTLQVECHRCGYEWGYTGSSDYYASCPQCKTSVPIEGVGQEDDEAPATESKVSGDRAAGGDDIDDLADRVGQLETTASELHEAIETMMTRVAELEQRHSRVAEATTGGQERPSEPETTTAGHSNDQQRPSTVADGATSAAGDGGQAGTGRRSTPSDESRGASGTGKEADGRARNGQDDSGRTGVSARSDASDGSAAGAVRPTADEGGKYDYVCPSCDGPISGEPDACIHCGTGFTW